MTQAEFINAVSKKANLSKTDSKRAYDAIFELIKETLKEGEKVNIQGFGTFKVSERGEYEGRNPLTGNKIIIAASKKAIFKPSKTFKDELNEKD